MRFLKRQSTNLRSLSGKGVHYDTLDEVILDSKNVVRLPRGTSSERPKNPVEGHLRYNLDKREFEGYQDGAWREIGFKEPFRDPGIVQQNLGNGDGVETDFGPLNSQHAEYPVPVAAQNIIVLIENVFQISTTNYTLVQNPVGKPEGYYVRFGTAVPFGKPVTVLHNFDK